METESAAFDSHDFVKRLISAGMPEAQAEILAQGQSRRNEHLATQRDIKEPEAATKRDIKELEVELKRELKEHGAAIKALEATVKEQEAGIKALELAITKQEAAIKLLEVNLTRDLKDMEHKLTIKLGAFIGVGITLLAALITLLTAAVHSPTGM